MGEDYWNREAQKQQRSQETFKADVSTVMKRFNQTTGVHTVQVIYGCELDDDGTVRGYRQDGYDGEDFISFDLKTLTWTAAKPQAVITKNKWDNDPGYNVGQKNYLEKECIEWLKQYLSYGRETLERKVRPETSSAPPPEVVCHATGFFPKAVMIFWRKEGEDVHEDVELRETLPNQDGSFQKRSILKVSAEELQKHIDGLSTAIITGVVVALIILVVAVVVGIMVWKKKNSGFKRAPASEESSSTNS